MKNIILFIFMFSIGSSFGQVENIKKNDKKAQVHLIGGTLLDVTILDWDFDVGIKVLTIWDQELFIPKDKIKKVVALNNAQLKTPYRFKNKGVYYALNAGVIVGNHGNRLYDRNGYTMSFASGYRFSRLLSLGLGTGIDQYAYKSGEHITPIFLDIRSFLFPRNTTIAFNLQMGYGLAFTNENKNIVDAKGGFMFYPNIGLSFGEGNNKYSIDIGYKFQQSTWTYASQWDRRNQTEYDLGYQRVVLRFGLVL